MTWNSDLLMRSSFRAGPSGLHHLAFLYFESVVVAYHQPLLLASTPPESNFQRRLFNGKTKTEFGETLKNELRYRA